MLHYQRITENVMKTKLRSREVIALFLNVFLIKRLRILQLSV